MPRLAQPRLPSSTVSGVSTPGVVRHISPFSAALNALGLERTVARATDAPDAQAVLETFRISETFRWLRRWAVVAVIAIVTPLTVVDAWANDMPVFHHVAVPLAVAIIVPAWVVELSGVRWPRIALIAATVLPNVWLTLIGHNTTNYLWLPLLVAWVGFAAIDVTPARVPATDPVMECADPFQA